MPTGTRDVHYHRFGTDSPVRGRNLATVNNGPPARGAAMLHLLVAALPPKAHPHILLVDDEADIRETLTEILETRLGAKVHSADSGKAGLEVLRNNRGDVDLIVTDFRMPGMNGLQFLAEAEKVAPGVPHVMVTAFDVIDSAIRPPSQVLHKPFGEGEFLGVVASALEGSA